MFIEKDKQMKQQLQEELDKIKQLEKEKDFEGLNFSQVLSAD